MVDLEPFLEAPFEEASNRSFEALLLIGVGLLATVAVLGRSTVTMAVVAVYLCLIPGYVGFRVRVWDREAESVDDESVEADDGSDVDASESVESDTERDGDGEAAAGEGETAGEPSGGTDGTDE
ncbi:hypothetical protein [Natronorubrum sp. FCH18a]|uniref:hypothetical protein n=1 Tax=Natronorubrum sp. FCH18a TaxID=3447018 RepID=UPI003F50F512